jgi:hypothetical protein
LSSGIHAAIILVRLVLLCDWCLDAKRELQKQTGGVPMDLNQHNPSTTARQRRPGILGYDLHFVSSIPHYDLFIYLFLFYFYLISCFLVIWNNLIILTQAIG